MFSSPPPVVKIKDYPTIDYKKNRSPEQPGSPVAGRRITVQNVVIWHERMGKSPDEISEEHDLTLADVHAALAFYFDHRWEIEQSIKDEEAFAAELKKKMHRGNHSRLDVDIRCP